MFHVTRQDVADFRLDRVGPAVRALDDDVTRGTADIAGVDPIVVVAIATDHRVSTMSAIDDVVAAPGLDGVAGPVAGDALSQQRNHALHVVGHGEVGGRLLDPDGVGAAARIGVLEHAHEHARAPGRIRDHIGIVAGAAEQTVLPAIAYQAVVAGAAGQIVVVGVAGDDVGERIAASDAGRGACQQAEVLDVVR